MRLGIRAEIAARVFLTLGALLPYWPLLTFDVIYVPDDIFASDIFNGELPGRLLVGELIRHGQAPVWTNQLCSGLSLAGAGLDPIGVLAFSLLPPAAALDSFIIVLLLVAAHGAYGLARQAGADRFGAVLAGVAFAGSGYIACQLKHLAIVATVVWLPVGLLLIGRTFAVGSTFARRACYVAQFGLVFAVQVLSGFPQSAYICALTYGSYALFRAVTLRERLGRFPLSLILLAGLATAILLGAAGGAVVLLPLSELGSMSDRAGPAEWAWATQISYWPPNVLTFLVPYATGDISNLTYGGPSIFWEDYGYVGAATFLLAIFGTVRDRRRPVVLFFASMTIVAYLLVLGPATPVFRIAFELVPGMNQFRLPTRFLVVVDLGLAVLGAIGLTRLLTDVERLAQPGSRLPRLVGLAFCLGTALDLFVHQPRQNPMVRAQDWLAPPRAVAAVQSDTPHPRTYTPQHRELHGQSFMKAQGWTDVKPYFELRDVLQPNVGGGYWNTPSADCYAGISPRWYVDVWGDHSRASRLIGPLAKVDFEAGVLRLDRALPHLLRTYGVTHLLSAYPIEGIALPLVTKAGGAYIYRVGGARLRIARAARHVTTSDEAVARLLDSSFDPDREILLHDAPHSVGPTIDNTSSAPRDVVVSRVMQTYEDSRQLVIAAETSEDGFLLIANTFDPGWRAWLDGRPVPLYRSNISLQGVQLPKGRHEVRLTYQARAFFRGLHTTLVSWGALLIWAGAAAYMARRARR